MRAIFAAAATLALAGCATTSPPPTPAPIVLPPPAACPSGLVAMRTAQLFFGRHIAPGQAVSDAQFRQFVDEVLTPAFPAGLTVLDGGGQWRGAENQLIREASKVVILVVPETAETERKIAAVREAYKTRFRQESVLLITQQSCVGF